MSEFKSKYSRPVRRDAERRIVNKLTPQELEAIIDYTKGKVDFEKRFQDAVHQMENHLKARLSAFNAFAMFQYATLICCVLHDKFNFGPKRLHKVITETGKLAYAINHKEIDFNLIRETLKEEQNIDLCEDDPLTILFGGKVHISPNGEAVIEREQDETDKRLSDPNTELSNQLPYDATVCRRLEIGSQPLDESVG